MSLLTASFAAVAVCVLVGTCTASDISVLHAFSGADGAKAKGSLTVASCGSETWLYGCTSQGGKYGGGVVFGLKFDGLRVDGTTFSVLHHFEAQAGDNETFAEGHEPHHGSLVADCARGMLYGTALAGGAKGEGMLFAIATAPPHTYEALVSLPKGGSHGGAHSGLAMTADGHFYGVTCSGGDHKMGSVFRFDPDARTIETIYSFPKRPSALGGHPHGSVTPSPDGRKLFGVTRYGGLIEGREEGMGVVFALGLDKAASGDKDAAVALHTFAGAPKDGGTSEHGSVVIVTQPDGSYVLAGTTTNGGANDTGTFFRMGADGSDYAVLHSFNASADPLLTGAHPYSTPTAVNSLLCGTTRNGGVHRKGTVYCVDTADGWAAATVASFKKKGTGQHPIDNLVSGPGNPRVVYGLTESGGPNGANGTLFVLAAPESIPRL